MKITSNSGIYKTIYQNDNYLLLFIQNFMQIVSLALK